MNVSSRWPQPLKRYNPTGFRASVDLAAASVKHLALLCAVDTFPRTGLYEGPYAEDAIRRYEKIWLPLYAAVSSEEQSSLVPPLDVAWVWHVHRLRPGAYIEYCKQAYGRELHVEAAAQAFSFTNGSGAGKATWRAWLRQSAGEALDPLRSRRLPDYSSWLKEYLLPELRCHGAFLHQVLRAPYLDGAFLAQAQQRYMRYMQLATAAAEDNPGLLAPTVDVCHMWRTHVSISGAYKQDSLAALHQLYEPASLVPQLWSDERAEELSRVWDAHWDGEYRQPHTGVIPDGLTHPAYELLGKVLQLIFILPPPGEKGSWRAGAHALYLMWLIRRGRVKGANSCWRRSAASLNLYCVRYMIKKAVLMRMMNAWPIHCEHKFWVTNFRAIITDMADAPAAAVAGGRSGSGQQGASAVATPGQGSRPRPSQVRDSASGQLDARNYFYSPFYYGWEAGATPFGQHRWKHNSVYARRKGSVTGNWGAGDADEFVDGLPDYKYSGHGEEVFKADFDCQFIEFSATGASR